MEEKVNLIVKTHAFGDALLTTPAVRELTRSGRWWVLAGPSTFEIWSRFPGIEKILKVPFPPEKFLDYFRLFIWTLKYRSIFQCISVSYVFGRDRMLRKWIRFLTGSSVKSLGTTPLGKWEEVFPAWNREFIGLSYARLCRVEPESYRPVFSLSNDEISFAGSILDDGKWFAVVPGGAVNPRDSVMEKRWPQEKFTVLVLRILENGGKVVLIGGKDDIEIANSIEKKLGETPGLLNLAGKTTWWQTASVIKRCRMLISIDSGPAHLAVALGTSATVLFGPTDPDQLYYRDTIRIVRSSAECSPCYSNRVFSGCSTGKSDCMLCITPDDVWRHIREVLVENNNT